MRKIIPHGFAVAVFSLVVFAAAVCAQEPEGATGRHDLIIGEALDQIEQSLGPDAVEAQRDEAGQTFGVKIIPLLHAEASSLVEELQRMKSPDGEVTYNAEDRALVLRDLPGRLEAMSVFVKRMDVLLETGIFALEYVNAADIIADVKRVLSRHVGQARPDGETNSIIVTDTPVKIAEVKEVVRKLDRLNAQVLISSRILEIVLNDEHPDGVDWEAIVSAYQELPVSEDETRVEQLDLGTISREDYDILLEALDTVGVVRTVLEEDTKTENETTGVVNGPVLSEGDNRIRFYLTPRVRKEEPLEIAIKTRKAGRDDVTVKMKNGETIVIGGLFKDVTVASTWKIPLLGDLPLLGFVFRNEGEESRKAEVISFLTVETAQKKEM